MERRNKSRHITYPMDYEDNKVISVWGKPPSVYFPNLEKIIKQSHHYRFFVTEIPRRPWPLTINGLPFTVVKPSGVERSRLPLLRGSDGVQDAKWNFGKFSLFGHLEVFEGNKGLYGGNGEIEICADIDATVELLTDEKMREIARVVTEKLSSDPKSKPRITEIMFTMEKKIIVVMDVRLCENLPGRIARCEATYMQADILPGPRWDLWSSWPHPAPNWPNDPEIQDEPMLLFPGTKLVGSLGPGRRNNQAAPITAGILVKEDSDRCFMTIPGHALKEYGLVRVDRFFDQHIIGRIMDTVYGTDVGLVRLDENVKFTNAYPPGSRKFIRLFGEDPDNDAIPWNTVVHFACEFPASLEGVVVAKSVRVVGPKLTTARYLVYHYVWTGQVMDGLPWDHGRPRPEEVTAGAALVDEKGVVTGIYTHDLHGVLDWTGFSLVLSASELVKAGYTLI
ncbi:hypothetical protein F53441_10822 [Fusarium austroafricanum]|uniref:Uncharacterized protein n=1 Tax=Fusarium austroafricanum TaxID=2364996 RepID=A0A8H4NV04_9HYPO|nr:hypothetical protein F53441_10822 [Fusarium austroafricanum]